MRCSISSTHSPREKKALPHPHDYFCPPCIVLLLVHLSHARDLHDCFEDFHVPNHIRCECAVKEKL